jgi:hypothetical protein
MSLEPAVLNWELLHFDFHQVFWVDHVERVKASPEYDARNPVNVQSLFSGAWKTHSDTNRYAKALLRRYANSYIKILALKDVAPDGASQNTRINAFCVWLL